MADALVSGTSTRKGVGVQLPPSAPKYKGRGSDARRDRGTEVKSAARHKNPRDGCTEGQRDGSKP